MARAALIAGVSLNLAVLGYFKYANFLIDNVAALTGARLTLDAVVLPLGISFITFQKIAYLVDVHRRATVERSFLRFALFVSFFPQLIAGPIVHHQEVMPQFARAQSGRWQGLAVGAVLFVLGLFKKVVIADTLAIEASGIFNAVAHHGLHPMLLQSWVGVTCYTFQIYFDFSAYSDMAVGLAWMFGIRMPMNFASPYQADSIVDFWRRWHITLSRFLRDYLYVPLGGNRHGEAKRYRNVFLTMLLGGIWHGAGWTFVLWGALHGTLILLNHAWTEQVTRRWGFALPRAVAWPLTFAAVAACWVAFRADSLAAAGTVYAGIFGLNGVAFSRSALGLLDPDQTVVMLAVAGAIAFACPNVYEFLGDCNPALPTRGYPATAPADADPSRERRVPFLPLRWAPTWPTAVLIGILFTWSVLKLTDVSEFIYFRF
jgi:D-alanyl-lipoteichoic acid acyltransferase DltB (MBOAT superfamily)